MVTFCYPSHSLYFWYAHNIRTLHLNNIFLPFYGLLRNKRNSLYVTINFPRDVYNHNTYIKYAVAFYK